MIHDHLRDVRIGEETKASDRAKRGTTVRVSELIKDFRSLRDESAIGEMSLIFALYLRQYNDVEVTYSGQRVDPAASEERSETISLSPIKSEDENKEYPVNLEIVEWRIDAPRKLYFCTEHGFPLDDDAPGIQAPGFNFTAYLKSEYFSKLLAENTAELARLDPVVQKALEESKREMRTYFRKRSSEKARGLVKEWQDAELYPFKGEPQNDIENAERQVFNVVALNVSSYLPDFDETDRKTKRFESTGAKIPH